MSNFSFDSDDRSYVVYEEDGNRLFEKVNEYFRKYALSKNAVEYTIPSMIDRSVLEKCGYMSSFPQHLTSAAYIDSSDFGKVSNDNKCTVDNMKISDKFFTPAACLHIYPCLSGKKIKNDIITTLANVFRSETKEYNASTRLWNFHVRELIFAGTEEFVTECLSDIMNEAKRFAEGLGLSVELENASDNFYPTKRNGIKERLQRNNSLKQELITYIGGKKVALGSFNFHGNHFSGPFDFSDNNRVVTGCAGFGLERWVTALKNIR